MSHLAAFRPRARQTLAPAQSAGWALKRYAILADGRRFDGAVADAALVKVLQHLPEPGQMEDGAGNHGIGFQIVHFAETAIVAPMFYWQWGSVLSRGPQGRADWARPLEFASGPGEIIGCLWELDIVQFEIAAWRACVLDSTDPLPARRAAYLARAMPPCESAP